MKHRTLLCYATGFITGAITVAALPALADKREVPMAALQTVVEIWNRISADYVDPVDDAKLRDGCIAGMAALDTHSYFLNPAEFKEMSGSSSAGIAGIGLELANQNGQTVVITPVEGGAAARADIWPGDVILQIDAKPLMGMKLPEVVKLLRGEKDSQVTLKVLRTGMLAPEDRILKREILRISSARAERLPGGLVYLRISSFTTSSGRQVRSALDAAFGTDKPAGIVMDLRRNPGGVLNGAVDVANLFVRSGTILSIEGRVKEANRTFEAKGLGPYVGVPMVVLVDGGTAAGSEILADAVRAYEGAKLLGEKTFGSGTIQTILPLQDDSALKITTARWKSATGQVIEGNGLTPDIAMPVPQVPSTRDTDPLVLRAMAEFGLQPPAERKPVQRAPLSGT